jgi:hypothetical protein
MRVKKVVEVVIRCVDLTAQSLDDVGLASAERPADFLQAAAMAGFGADDDGEFAPHRLLKPMSRCPAFTDDNL